jgi:hypothetical protein
MQRVLQGFDYRREVTMQSKIFEATANYFGLLVEVIHQLEQCSLIQFEEREFVVDTGDLVYGEVRVKCARQRAA